VPTLFSFQGATRKPIFLGLTTKRKKNYFTYFIGSFFPPLWLSNLKGMLIIGKGRYSVNRGRAIFSRFFTEFKRP
jgi:hypothetical protein